MLYIERRGLHVPRGLRRSRGRRAADRRDVGDRDRPQPGDARRRRSTRKYANLATQYPGAVAGGRAGRPRRDAPALPLAGRAVAPQRRRRTSRARRGLAGARAGSTASLPSPAAPAADDATLVIRAAVPTPDGTRMVIADLPVDADDHRAAATTGPARGSAASRCRDQGGDASAGDRLGRQPAESLELFQQTVAFMDCRDWADRRDRRRCRSALDAPVGRLYSGWRGAVGSVVADRREQLRRFHLRARRARRAVPHHPGRRRSFMGALLARIDHVRRARAVRRHRARPAGRLRAPHHASSRATSSAIWPSRSTA